MLLDYWIAVDLGQVADYSAVCVLGRHEQHTGREEWVSRFLGDVPGWVPRPQTASHYRIIHLERLPLQTSYADIPDRLRVIEDRCRQLWLEHCWEVERTAARARRHTRRVTDYPTLDDAPVQLVIDQTGVGRAVLDLFRAAGLEVIGISITGGESARWVSSSEAHVSKRALVSVTQALMHSRRVKAASGLADWPVLKAELGNFRAKISLSGHASFEAGPAEEWREGAHDDLVLALALGLWAGEEFATRGQATTFAEIRAAWDLPRVPQW